jgi:putative ABC transport system permease protein
MIIGVTAVIALMSASSGVEAEISDQIQGPGTDLVAVIPASAQVSSVTTGAGSSASLTYDDAEAIADPANVPSALAVSPELRRPAQSVFWAGECPD